jgi:hypothetical protein
MPRLLVVHHTPSPALQAMFEAAVSGARTDEIEGVEVVVRPALTAAAIDVLNADAYLLGTPVQLALGTSWADSACKEAVECHWDRRRAGRAAHTSTQFASALSTVPGAFRAQDRVSLPLSERGSDTQ